MRLIDADTLFEHKVYAETPIISGDFVPGFVIDRAPTIDAVPVVRCKDCKYAHSGNGIWYWCGTDERKRPSSFYCSAGRKKDEYDDQP